MERLSFGILIFSLATVGLVIAFMAVLRALRQPPMIAGVPPWSLSESLMEDVEIVNKDPGGIETSYTEMKPSASRFIALVGMVGILVLYLGFGLAALRRFADGLPLDNLSETADYFYAGLVLFVPYIANKLASVFEHFK